MEYRKAHAIALNLEAQIRPYCLRTAIVGSVRRKKPDVKDIEILAIPRTVDEKDMFGTTVGHTSLLDPYLETLGVSVKGGDKYKKILLPEGIYLDLFLCLPPAQWGVMQAIYTGPKDISQAFVSPRNRGGLLPSWAKIKDGWQIYVGGNPKEIPEEKDFFSFCEIGYIEPENRGDWRKILHGKR